LAGNWDENLFDYYSFSVLLIV